IKEKNLDKIDQIEKIIYQISEFRLNLEELHGHQISTIVNAELYSMAFEIYQQVEIRHKQTKVNKFRNFVDHITVHSIWGYFILALILLGSYFLVFLFGNEISSLMDALLTIWTPGAEKLFGGNETWLYKIIWDGFISGLFAGVGGILPYVIPFYFVIEILQDIGYLPRAAYLMDRFMHKIGVHGKTIIPMLLGFGCSVPAVSACTIMETEQQRRRSILISTLIPCSAITTIIMGLIANFLGIGYAFLMYGIVLIVIIAVGKVLNINSDNKESELIIELHDFRKPNFKVIFKQAWHRSKEFVYMALPLIIILGILMQILMEFNLLNWINIVFQPLTVYVLGLPIGISIYLLYGFLRKELNLILLSLYISSLNMTLNEYMTPIQMIVFMIVTLFYLPCLATFITIRKEAGKKFAWKYLLFRIVIASILAALFRWLYKGINLIFPDSVMKFSGKFLITYLLFGMTIFTLVYIYKVHKKNHPFKRKHKRYNSEYHKKQHGLKREHHKMHQKSKIKEFYKLQTCKTCSHLGNCPLVTQGRSCSDIDIENPEFVYEKDDKK
ncbi:MAG: nucleoside recognition domain-containing protein, partial [Promethearchaeota archaeon]